MFPIGSQFNEDVILADRFRCLDNGFLVDVGAADGQHNSNSMNLIKRGWGGILIEPEIKQFAELISLYSEKVRVRCINCAIGTKIGPTKFYACGQYTTSNDAWKKRCETEYNDAKYECEFVIDVHTLTSVLCAHNAPKDIDFLTIDCEGNDLDVFDSLD